MSLRCSIAISRESRPSNHHCWEHLWWLGMHGQRFKWELPACGSASCSAAVLKADTSSDGFLAQVLGSEFSGDALGDSSGYAEWLGTVLARPEHIIPVLLWDWCMGTQQRSRPSRSVPPASLSRQTSSPLGRICRASEPRWTGRARPQTSGRMWPRCAQTQLAAILFSHGRPATYRRF